MLAFFLAIAANSSTCTGGQDPDTVAKRNALISTMEKQVSQYQGCKNDSDCTYLPDIGGLILNKEGLVYVQTCAKRLKKALFPGCFSTMLSSQPDFGMEPDRKKLPNEVECSENRCTSSNKNPKMRDWAKENSDLRSNFSRNLKLDRFCEEEIKKVQTTDQAK